jgi:molybdopterin/thiamine biosynthesis adenylyltransferase
MDVIVIPSEPDPFARIPKELTGALRDKRVAIVGLGSGGSEVALNLASAGVGNLVMFDDDRLHQENYIRHLLDKRDLGRMKVTAIIDALKARDLPTKAVGHAINVLWRADYFRDNLAEARPDVLICATDSNDSRRFINMCAVGLNIPLVIAGILDGGHVGEVICVMPRKTACYECVRLALGAALAGPESGERASNPYLGVEEDGRSFAVQRFDVTFVSSVATRVALQVLDPERYEPLPAEYVVWGREKGNEHAPPFNFLYPLSFNFVPISRQTHCPVCGRGADDLGGVDIDGRFAEIIAELDRVQA